MVDKPEILSASMLALLVKLANAGMQGMKREDMMVSRKITAATLSALGERKLVEQTEQTYTAYPFKHLPERAVSRHYWRVSRAGAEAINRADLFAQPATAAAQDAGDAPRWTAAELAAYSEDNPYPPHTPGATADDTLASYEYEIAALKQQLADVRSELVTFAIIIHQCVGLSELMLVGYDTENGNALLKRAEAYMNEPVQQGE